MLEKQEWMNRFVAQCLKRGIDETLARDLAKDSYESGPWDADDTPEEVADGEIYYLTH